MNIPVESNSNIIMDKLLLHKEDAIGSIKVKNLDYDNLILETEGYIEYFGEHCVALFISEM